MLRNKIECIVWLLFFSEFYKYGTNTGSFRLKRNPANTGGIHLFPLLISFSYFFRKYRNEWDKYRNTSGTGHDFFRLSSLGRGGAGSQGEDEVGVAGGNICCIFRVGYWGGPNMLLG